MTTDKIREVLSKIDLAIKKYPELQSALTQRYGVGAFATSEECSALLQGIDAKVDNIQRTLDIEIEPSVDYGFIPDETLRETLYTLNRSMELKILNIERTDKTRAYLATCVDAFKQIEGVARFVARESRVLEQLTEEHRDPLTKEKVDISTVIYRLTRNFWLSSFSFELLHSLRYIRNVCEHPATSLGEKQMTSVRLFMEQLPTGGSVRGLLILCINWLEQIYDGRVKAFSYTEKSK